ncbi:B3 domain-containing protein At5g60130-like isoform X2 [Pistacia vera]|nr:B3 domain-containing protein At5g60130-like isoform X2 [Pistacia vera]
MSLGYIRSEVFFQHGWQNYVKDNCVECGDFLVFNYDVDHKFDIMIFGRYVCEKIKSSDFVGMDKEVKMEDDDIVGVDVSDDQSNSESNKEDSDDSEYNAGEEEEEDTASEEEAAATTILMTRQEKMWKQ